MADSIEEDPLPMYKKGFIMREQKQGNSHVQVIIHLLKQTYEYDIPFPPRPRFALVLLSFTHSQITPTQTYNEEYWIRTRIKGIHILLITAGLTVTLQPVNQYL